MLMDGHRASLTGADRGLRRMNQAPGACGKTLPITQGLFKETEHSVSSVLVGIIHNNGLNAWCYYKKTTAGKSSHINSNKLLVID